MAKLKPWYQVIVPREDLREGKPLDAAEFAVHLDQVRDGRARKDYQDPARFFSRTFLTQNLLELTAGALRRLAGETTASSTVFKMTTQFGGGKTPWAEIAFQLGGEAGFKVVEEREKSGTAPGGDVIRRFSRSRWKHR